MSMLLEIGKKTYIRILSQRARFVNRLHGREPAAIMNTKICSTYGGVLTLELNRLTRDVDQMGRACDLAKEELAGRAAEAGSVLASQPQVTKELLQKIGCAPDRRMAPGRCAAWQHLRRAPAG